MTTDPDTIRPGSRGRGDPAHGRVRLPALPVVDGARAVGVVALRDCSIEDLAAMHAELETRRVVAERAW